jgi:hypothetical protein
LINISIAKYVSNPTNTHILAASFVNIGIDKYAMVNAKTNALNVEFPYLLYSTAVHTPPLFVVGLLPDK